MLFFNYKGILDGVREVLIIFDQKGKNMTFGDLREAYQRGRKSPSN